jgi:hypothetical protein
MLDIEKKTTTFVAGFVRTKEGRDGNLSFKILGQWFIVPSNSTYAKRVREAKRVLVLFEKKGSEKYPRILSVTKDPTYQQIREAEST